MNFVQEGAVYSNVNQMYFIEVQIAWEPPIEPNGNISGYQYTIQDSGGAIVFSDNVTGTSLARNVTVFPYTNYTVTVQASTSAGSGGQVVEIVLSPEAGDQSVMFV